MQTGASRSTKSAPRRSALIERIRSRIVCGELAPGSRLPSHLKMVQDLGACKRTIQEALSELKRDGFIETHPSSGTFIADNPPHLSRYALVLSPDPTELNAPFETALLRELSAIEKEHDCRFACYHNVTAHSDTIEYQELLWDIRAHRVAGLLFRDDLIRTDLSDAPFWTTPGVPRVVLCADPSQPAGYAGVAAIGTDDHAFIERAIGYLHDRGRTRLALLSGTELTHADTADFAARAERHGMAVNPHWLHYGLSSGQARKVTELLMWLPADKRPDGIILVNEFLVEPVATGILASGMQMGRDLDVVAYSNMPCIGSPAVPIRRLGVDMRQRLRIALDLLDRQKRGESMPPCVLLPPVFEEELSVSMDGT